MGNPDLCMHIQPESQSVLSPAKQAEIGVLHSPMSSGPSASASYSQSSSLSPFFLHARQWILSMGAMIVLSNGVM